LKIGLVILLSIAVIALLFAGAMSYIYLRPRPSLTASGVITSRSFQPAHTINRYQGGARREVWTQQNIRVPDMFVFEIQVEGHPDAMQFAMPATAASRFTVGTQVQIQYVERGLPFMRSKPRVLQMR
jgi:hypothetical protein